MKALQERQTNAQPSVLRMGIERIAVILVFAAVLLSVIVHAVGTIGTAARDGFEKAKTATAQQVRQKFYDTSFEIAEKTHHVSNRATISLEDVRAVQNLQVLRVSEVAYRFNVENPEGNLFLSLWDSVFGAYQYILEIRQDGVFSVDLQAAEFITDPMRQTVLVRVPLPELSSLQDQISSEVVYEHEGIVTEMTDANPSLPQEEQAAAAQEIREKILSNESYLTQAKDQAAMILENLIRQCNPDMPDLKITVEFFE